MSNFVLPPRCTPDVWSRIADSGLPVVIYGTGNGADKIIDVLSEKNIEVSDIFASDGFVRSRTFRGHTVCSYSEICEKYDDFAVVFAFGSSRPEVLDTVEKIARERVFFAPDVPLCGDLMFDSAYYKSAYDDFSAVAEMLADDESRRILSDIIFYKMTGDISYLRRAVSPSYPLLDTDTFKTVLDLGAYTGDTVRRFASMMPKLEAVIAVEPDLRAYKKLLAYAESCRIPSVTALNAAAWDDDGVIEFTSNSGRGSSAKKSDKLRRGEKSISVPSRTPDTLSDGRHIDFIKYDVEGAEARALRGSRGIIGAYAPELLVSAYHRTEDLIALPRLIRSIDNEYKLYFRRDDGIPAWDINLIAKK